MLAQQLGLVEPIRQRVLDALRAAGDGGATVAQLADELAEDDHAVHAALRALRRERLARTDLVGAGDRATWWHVPPAPTPGPTEREQSPVPLASVGPLPHWTVDVIERVGPTASSAELRAQLDVVESRLRVIEAQRRAARRARNELHALLRARLRGRQCT